MRRPIQNLILAIANRRRRARRGGGQAGGRYSAALGGRATGGATSQAPEAASVEELSPQEVNEAVAELQAMEGGGAGGAGGAAGGNWERIQSDFAAGMQAIGGGGMAGGDGADQMALMGPQSAGMTRRPIQQTEIQLSPYESQAFEPAQQPFVRKPIQQSQLDPSAYSAFPASQMQQAANGQPQQPNGQPLPANGGQRQPGPWNSQIVTFRGSGPDSRGVVNVYGGGAQPPPRPMSLDPASARMDYGARIDVAKQEHAAMEQRLSEIKEKKANFNAKAEGKFREFEVAAQRMRQMYDDGQLDYSNYVSALRQPFQAIIERFDWAGNLEPKPGDLRPSPHTGGIRMERFTGDPKELWVDAGWNNQRSQEEKATFLDNNLVKIGGKVFEYDPRRQKMSEVANMNEHATALLENVQLAREKIEAEFDTDLSSGSGIKRRATPLEIKERIRRDNLIAGLPVDSMKITPEDVQESLRQYGREFVIPYIRSLATGSPPKDSDPAQASQVMADAASATSFLQRYGSDPIQAAIGFSKTPDGMSVMPHPLQDGAMQFLHVQQQQQAAVAQQQTAAARAPQQIQNRFLGGVMSLGDQYIPQAGMGAGEVTQRFPGMLQQPPMRPGQMHGNMPPPPQPPPQPTGAPGAGGPPQGPVQPVPPVPQPGLPGGMPQAAPSQQGAPGRTWRDVPIDYQQVNQSLANDPQNAAGRGAGMNALPAGSTYQPGIENRPRDAAGPTREEAAKARETFASGVFQQFNSVPAERQQSVDWAVAFVTFMQAKGNERLLLDPRFDEMRKRAERILRDAGSEK